LDGGVLVDYIKRTLEQKILEINEDYSCLLLIGPRQVGKTTMLEHLMEGTNRQKVTLDDTENRRLAKTDPALFLELHPAPVLIDEVQYAPELFSYIKINVDNGAAPGSYWLTGSQAFHLMELAQESLAGRTAIVHMSALSQSELYGDHWSEPLSLDLQKLNSRKEHLAACGSAEMFERIWNGGMPGHRSGRFKDRDVFYSSYIQTYINRDVTDMIPGVDKLLFADFIRAAACRVGQMLNTHDIAGDVGVSDDTAKRWLQVLEKSEVIFYLRPYSNNLLKRTVKTPKMYFFDTGLVAYLTKYSSPEILMNGAINGAILENYTVAEIRKTWLNSAKECLMHYYRDKDTNEIDMVVEADGELHPLEIKKSTNPGTELASAFKVLDKGSVPRGAGAILCLREEVSAIDRSTFILPIWMI
jgi:predicted AAA+ superfamily ATPase